MIYRLFKTIIILGICFSITFSSYAAVSVSDGSTFVTKSEFQADLSNISNRMAQVENSIDARIDSLVSAYLTRNGIWNGAKQTVLNNLGTLSTTAETGRVLENVDKTGLILMPYYVNINYDVGICTGNDGGKTGDSLERMYGSPVFYSLNIEVGMYNESNDSAYQTKNYFYGLAGEYDTGSAAGYRLQLQTTPTGVFMFFLSKGDNVKFKFNTTLDARADWWALTLASPITGNQKTLSGKAIRLSSDTNRYGNWISGSTYTMSFGLSSTSVSIY